MRLRPVLTALTVGAVLTVGLLASCSTTTNTSTGGNGGTNPPATTPGSTTTPSSPAGSLVGTSWTLTSYQGPARASVPAAPGATATLAFAAGGGLTGSTGCNQFSGTYTLDGQKLTIALGPMTLVGCTGPLLTAQETAVTTLLPTVAGFTVTADTLALTDAGGATVLTYEATETGLEGSSWKVTGVNNGREAVESTALTEKLTASFGAGGAFTGFGGCNDLTGTYATTGTDGLSITGLAATRKACGADVDATEAQYTAALAAVTTYQVSGNTLTMRNSAGATQVTAQRA